MAAVAGFAVPRATGPMSHECRGKASRHRDDHRLLPSNQTGDDSRDYLPMA
jgi:hypothetical protein